MHVPRWVYAVVLFLSGLGVGVLWCPCRGSQRTPDSRVPSYAQPEYEKYVEEMRGTFGEETADFLSQFKELTIHIKKYPIEAWASPDGRFVIRLAGSGELIASELRDPMRKGTTELVRHYSFSCGDKTYSCDFARNNKGSRMTNVQFHFVDAKGGGLSYVDNNADGRWDWFTDETHKPPTFYVRDGLCWKERKVAGDKAPKRASSGDSIHNY
jgi:hypothetical protein